MKVVEKMILQNSLTYMGWSLTFAGLRKQVSDQMFTLFSQYCIVSVFLYNFGKFYCLCARDLHYFGEDNLQC